MAMEELQPRSQALRNALGKPKDSAANEQMLSVAEAHKRLGISRHTLYRLIRTGELVSVKIGSRRLISPRAIVKFIRQLEEEAEA